MKELSIVIKVKPLNSGIIYTLLADPFSLIPVKEESSAGNLYNCSQEIIVEQPDQSTYNLFSQPVESIVTYKDSTNREIQIGTTNIPATVTLFPYLNTSRLSISCKMLQSPFCKN